ncbi:MULTISPECIES: sigma-E factor negative regulatory protein [Ramlibacter]|uniref:Anti-anti-sigma factor n=1 Tax=Ramlibacter aquaticus TaxID=2780094 RepID=A0ABR9SHX4_9BURK|nr:MULTISPECIES: sigma-E factor negative regulatory protein [Ramlibacter]MBE7941955.1 anti-anti-sigma factor [Ramlibacter aquaticus]
MDSKNKREWMSALADGELRGEALAQGLALAGDAQAQQAWQDYHLIGDVLRAADLAATAPPDRFLARLQERLANERPFPAEEVAVLQPPVAVAAREAANDGSFRWKLVAGFASLAAVGAVAWSVAGAPAAAPRGAELAQSAPASTVMVGTERGAVIRDARLDELLAAHRQMAGAAAPQGFLRNATYDTAGR